MPETFHDVRLPVQSDLQGIAARGFGLRSAEDLSASGRPKHPARRTRGTTSRTQGSQSLMTNLVSFTETRRVYYACIGLQKFCAVKFTEFVCCQ